MGEKYREPNKNIPTNSSDLDETTKLLMQMIKESFAPGSAKMIAYEAGRVEAISLHTTSNWNEQMIIRLQRILIKNPDNKELAQQVETAISYIKVGIALIELYLNLIYADAPKEKIEIVGSMIVDLSSQKLY